MKSDPFSVKMIFYVAVTALCLSCSTNNEDIQSSGIDYSESNNWVQIIDSGLNADVFYLYPTSWGRTSDTLSPVCTIDNPILRVYAPKAFDRQATLFLGIANIYAPYYRQVDATYLFQQDEKTQDSILRAEPLQDALKAFYYYIDHFNNGRPFILAGHSQGADVLKLLLDSIRNDDAIYNKMIAAYLIGCSVTDDFLAARPNLHFAEGADDTGVIISYNTVSSDTVAYRDPVVKSGALAINPINWKRDETYADKSENSGSVVVTPNAVLEKDSLGNYVKLINYADAQVNLNKGVVICSSVSDDTTLNSQMGQGIYHTYDIPFYYYNLKQNAANRIAKYLNKN